MRDRNLLQFNSALESSEKMHQSGEEPRFITNVCKVRSLAGSDPGFSCGVTGAHPSAGFDFAMKSCEVLQVAFA